MAKTKLAVCIGDEMYQNRFVKCLMSHYQSQFEVYIFTDLSEIQTQNAQECEVIIVGDCEKNELEDLIKCGKNILYLKEDNEETIKSEAINYTDKYQEVFKIVDNIEKLTGTVIQKIKENQIQNKRRIGVFSLTQEQFQIPFAAMLCNICGENQSVLLLDLQAFSGMLSITGSLEKEDMTDLLSMEDLMAVSITGVYTKGRLLSGIRRYNNFEYIHGVKNPECLAEGSEGVYQSMIDILTKELGYDCIVINFGSIFSGVLELMDSCDSCYFLVSKENIGKWRENIFWEVLKKHGKESFFCRIKRFEIPAVCGSDESWEQLAEKWCRSGIGDELRYQLWEKNGYETE